MFSHAPSHLNSSVKRQRTERGFVVLRAVGSAAFTFMEMAPLISNKAQGYACTKHINYLPPAHTVCSHLAKHCRILFFSLSLPPQYKHKMKLVLWWSELHCSQAALINFTPTVSSILALGLASYGHQITQVFQMKNAFMRKHSQFTAFDCHRSCSRGLGGYSGPPRDHVHPLEISS